ncbi:MAG: hypothetical protein ACE15F_01175 [bacterium]
MPRKPADDFHTTIHVARGFLGYIWMIVLAGSVILIVNMSMEVKRIRYSLGEKNLEKIRLLDELRRVENRIGELERYHRIAELVRTQLPQLGPPRHPAIELVVPGLQTRTGLPVPAAPELEEPGLLSRVRKYWQRMGDWVREQVHRWIE